MFGNDNQFLKAKELFDQGYKEYKSDQDLEKAVQLVNDAVKLYSRLGNIDEYAKSLKLLGDIYDELNEFEKAQACYLNVINNKGKCNPKSYDVLCSFNMLANYNSRNNDKKALEYSLGALEIQRKRDPKGTELDTAFQLSSIAIICHRLGKLNEAIDHLLESLDILKGNTDSLKHIGIIHLELADIYKIQGEHNKALTHFNKASELGTNI